MKKIIFWCDDFYPNNTGYSNAFLGLITSILSYSNYFIEVFTTIDLAGKEEFKFNNLKITRLRKIKIPVLGYILTSVYYGYYINNYIKKNDFKLLFVETFDNVFFISLLNKSTLRKTIIRAHSTSDTEYTFFKNTIKYKIRKFIIKNYISKKVIYFSATNLYHLTFIKKFYLSNNLIDIGNKYFFLIPNTLNYSFKPNITSCIFYSNTLVKFLFLGRMDSLGFNQKGIMDLLIAWKALSENDKNKCNLTIVGAGIHSDYIRSISNKFLNINFIEKINHSDCLDLINSIDVVVLPSRYEGLSMFALESLALGKICLFSKVGGLIDLVNGNGFLFEPQDYLSLLLSIKKVINMSENDRLKMKKESIKIYKNKFSPIILAENFNFLYNTINR